MDSKEYSWKWVTADELLCPTACDLVSAHLVPDASTTATATYFDGQDTKGRTILRVRVAGSKHCDFDPAQPVYCRRGLYVEIVTNVRGILFQWRPRSSKEG
ncbi:unnamed protein product [marine sediment metagenome]|uniref:Uncharacterized protein n=1 Tax=marine sediment metagenome TaxID=412755 RepID=X1HVA1_9ZZZZ